jgi:SNF2 family DNA or RNA helicase
MATGGDSVFKGKLWAYQEEACERMVDRGQMLLAMTMGAGKTPTTLAAIEELSGEGEVDRCLVVVPASLKYQWKREIEKFTDSRVTVIDGSKAKRAQQWRLSINSLYVVVNTETLINDVKMIGVYQAMVVDEATIIKTRNIKRSRLVKRIGKTIPYRFALTGQPIENRPEELFSIMEFVDKDVLGTFEIFDRTFIVRDRQASPLPQPRQDEQGHAGVHGTQDSC